MLSRGFCHSGWSQSKNKRNQKDRQILEPCQTTKKLYNAKVTVIPTEDGALGMVPKCSKRGLEEVEIKGRIGDYPDDCQNTEKGIGDLKRLADTETPVKALQH